MAFLKQANAMVVHPRVSGRGWDRTRKTASSGASSRNLTDQAREILGGALDPDNFLFTHCFPAGHMVLMGDGTEKLIEDIAVGDLVVTHKGNVRPVTNLIRKEVDEDLVVIKSASVPEVACTGEHPFYIIRESDAWCRVFPSYQGQVKCTFGGKQVCEKHSCLTNGATPDWMDARDVRVGDRTYTPTLHRTEVPEDINPNRMRLLGYYVAEGRVDKDHDGRLHSIRFSIHEDEIPTLGTEIAGLMRMEFGVPSHSIIQDKKRDTKCVTLAFCSHEHAPWFLRHAGCGSRTKRLSPEVVWAPAEWQRQLMGSWMNGDGCYDGQSNRVGSNGIRLSTSSDDLASQAVVLLDRMGVHSRLQKVTTKGREYQGRWIKGTDGWHVEVAATYLPKLADVIHWDVEGTALNRLTTRRRYRYAASTLSTVEAVESRPFKGTVYNLSVQDDESYIVNRQAVHNCTIVASVDTDSPPDVKLGKVREASSTRTIDRRYADFLVKPESSQYVNNNGDSWSRRVLLASYSTFIGGQNFLEHVQVEEKSKGRIIDAVARDIGESVYIDILVATNRKHATLVQDIESGKMGTLSMGCTTDFTLCTKCGHYAVDETDLCDHIRHEKLNTFLDDRGQKRVIAELCGHVDYNENPEAPGGVRFIEASWVGVPAFPGAVMRNIMLAPEGTGKSDAEIRSILAAAPQSWSDAAMAKAASLHPRVAFDFESDAEGGDAPAAAAPEKAAPFQKLEDSLYETMTTRLRERIEREIREQNVEKAVDDLPDSDAPNDSIIKEGFSNPARSQPQRVAPTAAGKAAAAKTAAAKRYASALDTLVRVAASDIALVEGVASTNIAYGVSVPRDVYRAALKVGPIHKHPTPEAYLRSCRKAAGRMLSPVEFRVVVRVGTLLSRWVSFNNPSRNL